MGGDPGARRKGGCGRQNCVFLGCGWVEQCQCLWLMDTTWITSRRLGEREEFGRFAGGYINATENPPPGSRLVSATQLGSGTSRISVFYVMNMICHRLAAPLHP